MPPIPVERIPDGVAILLPESVVETLRAIPQLLESVSPHEAAGERLAAPVYLDDPAADREWWGLMAGELEESRRADRSAFEELVAAAAQGVVASFEEAEAMLRVLAEARLVFATRVGIEVETDYDLLEESARDLLDTLGVLQELLIGVLDT